MTFSLPYAIDTTRPGRIIIPLLLIAAFVAMPLCGLLLALARKPDQPLILLAPLAIALMNLALALILFRLMGGATGSIDSQAIIIKPARLFGIPSGAPGGSFALSRFRALAVKTISRQNPPLGRLMLLGHDKTPAILLFTGPLEQAQTLQKDLAAALNLPTGTC